jgi:hypothetical protein
MKGLCRGGRIRPPREQSERPPPLHEQEAPVRVTLLGAFEGKLPLMTSVVLDLEPKQVWKHFEA